MNNKITKYNFCTLIAKHKYLFLVAVIFILISETCIHIFQFVKGLMVELAIDKNIAALKMEILRFIILTVVINLSFYLYSKTYLHFSSLCIKDLKSNLFSSFINRPYREFVKNEQGKYINAYTIQVQMIESSFFEALFGFLQIVATIIPGLIFIYLIYPPLLIISIIGIGIALILPNLFNKKISQLQKQAIKADEKSVSLLNEFLNGIETIKSFSKEFSFINRFKSSTKIHNEIVNKWYKNTLVSFYLSQLVLNIYSVVSLLIVAYLLKFSQLSIADYIAVLGMLFNFNDNLPYASHYIQMFKSVKENLRYINETIDYELNVMDKETIELERVENIIFDNVSFCYPKTDKMILNDFDLVINQKGITQIKGESGKGKSTLLSLLCGYYPINKGEIKLSGININKISNLNKKITIMRQESIFFDGSLLDNITMFRDIPIQEVIDGLNQLGLDYLANKENLNSSVKTYSGGEARKLMVLRALLSKSEIIILDEPLANLDINSIKLLEKYLSNKNNCFLLIITHQNIQIPITLAVNI